MEKLYPFITTFHFVIYFIAVILLVWKAARDRSVMALLLGVAAALVCLNDLLWVGNTLAANFRLYETSKDTWMVLSGISSFLSICSSLAFIAGIILLFQKRN